MVSLGAEVVGISGDSVSSLGIFKKVHKLNFTLLSDPSGKIAEMFAVPVKEGGTIKKTVNGQQVTLTRGVTISRWTFVIDKAGRIAFKNTEVNAANDSKNVLAVIKKLH